MLGLTIPIGPRSSTGGSVGSGTGGGYAQVQATQSPVLIGDWGYQVYGAAGASNHEFGLLQYKSPWGLVSAGADRVGAQRLSMLKRRVRFPSPMVGCSPQTQSTTVLPSSTRQEWRGSGSRTRTVRWGGPTPPAVCWCLICVPTTSIAWLSTRPMRLPTQPSLSPRAMYGRQDRSGVVVRFPVRISHGALLRLVDEAGRPLPVGSVATLATTRAAVPVGYDGEAYVEDLDRSNKVTVEQPNGRRCAASFDYLPAPGEIPTIGPLACRENRP